MQCQCDYNVSIRVLQQYVKTQHPGNFTISDLYYNRFSQLGKPSVYHTPQRPQLQFYDVIFSLVIIRSLGHCTDLIVIFYGKRTRKMAEPFEGQVFDNYEAAP